MKALLTQFLLILSIPLWAIDTMNRESYVANLIRDGKKEILQKYLKKYPTHANGLTFTYEESEIVYSMLLFATELNQTEIAKLLLNLGADPNYSSGGESVVGNAVIQENLEILRALAVKKANFELEIYTRDKNWRGSVLHYISKQDQVESFAIVSSSIKDWNGLDSEGKSVCHHLVASNSWKDFFKRVPKGKLDCNKQDNDGTTPLGYAFEQDNLELLKFLLAYGANPNAVDSSGSDLCHWTVGTDEERYKELLGVLRNFKVACNTINNEGFRALDRLIDSHPEKEKIIKFLDITQDVKDSLFFFARLEYDNLPDPEIVKMLIRKGANANAKNSDDQTILFLAASAGDIEHIKPLLDAGADPNAGDYSDFTPLMVATLRNNQEVIRFLVKYKANKNLEDMEGKTAFDYAVEENKVEEAELVKVSKKK